MSGYEQDTARDIFYWTSTDAEYLTDKAIYFDMDGTIADLYGVDDWLEKLCAADPTPYAEAEPLVDPDDLWEFCSRASAAGFRIGIVSWLSKECSIEYAEQIVEAKLAWCDEFLPALDEIVLAPYGIPKSTIVLVPNNAILIDDEERNRIEWDDPECNRIAYPADNLLDTLEVIQEEFKGSYYYGNDYGVGGYEDDDYYDAYDEYGDYDE